VGESIQRDVIDGDVTKSYFFLWSIRPIIPIYIYIFFLEGISYIKWVKRW
jgi:hypothetical protein